MKSELLLASVLCAAITGCGSAESSEPGKDELRGWASVQIALAADGNSTPLAPKPKPGDPCENCGGDGVVGDGRIEAKCKACDGTGTIPVREDAKRAMPEGRSHRSFPGGAFRDDENWEPERRVLWRNAEGARREDEFYDGAKGNYWRFVPSGVQIPASSSIPSASFLFRRHGRL